METTPTLTPGAQAAIFQNEIKLKTKAFQLHDYLIYTKTSLMTIINGPL